MVQQVKWGHKFTDRVRIGIWTQLGLNNPTVASAQRFITCRYRTYWQICCSGGRDGSVGTATRYGFDSPEIEFRCGRDFQYPSRMSQGPNQSPVKCVPGLSRRYRDGGVALTTHLHLAPRLCKGRAKLLPPLRAIRTYYRVTFTFNMCQCSPLGLRDWRWGLRCSETQRNFSNLSPNDTATHRTPNESPPPKHVIFSVNRDLQSAVNAPRAYCVVTNIESLLSSVTCSSSSHILPPFPFHFLDTVTCLREVKMVKAQTPFLTGRFVLLNWSQHFHVSLWLTWAFSFERSPCNRHIKLYLTFWHRSFTFKF